MTWPVALVRYALWAGLAVLPAWAPAQPQDTPRALSLVGSARLRPLVAALAAGYAGEGASVKLGIQLLGDDTGVHALTAGVADVAILDRQVWEAEQRPFRQVAGGLPVELRIGVDRGGANVPPSVYVNARNPLRLLPWDRLARILTSGAGSGDITRWGQIGLAGAYGDRRIHVYGLRDGGGFATNVRLNLLDKRPYGPSYEALESSAAVIAAVRADPFGIAVLDDVPAKDVRALRHVALTPARAGEREPLTPYLRVYLAKSTEERPNREAAAFTRFMLSAAGQRIVAHYAAPLDAAELAVERAKLDRIMPGA